jgi:TP901-1 family phage major tail protein
MPKFAGKLITMSIETTTSGTYVAFGGLLTKSVRLNAAAIDITDGDSTDLFQEMLGGGGVKSLEISGSGRFNDDAAIERARSLFMTGTLATMRFLIPDWGTIQGAFYITSLEFGGNYDAEVTDSLSFMSSGKPTWTAV